MIVLKDILNLNKFLNLSNRNQEDICKIRSHLNLKQISHHKLKYKLVRKSKHRLEMQYQKTSRLKIWTQCLIMRLVPQDRKGFQIGSLQCLRIKLILKNRSLIIWNQVLQRKNYPRKTSLINLSNSFQKSKSQLEIDLDIKNQFKNQVHQSSH